MSAISRNVVVLGSWSDPASSLPKPPAQENDGLRVVQQYGAGLSGCDVSVLRWSAGRDEWRARKLPGHGLRYSRLFRVRAPKAHAGLYWIERDRGEYRAFRCEPEDGTEAQQLSWYRIDWALRGQMSCAGRVPAGDAPRWLWFNGGAFDPQPHFLILGKHGVLVGNVDKKPMAQFIPTAKLLRMKPMDVIKRARGF